MFWVSRRCLDTKTLKDLYYYWQHGSGSDSIRSSKDPAHYVILIAFIVYVSSSLWKYLFLLNYIREFVFSSLARSLSLSLAFLLIFSFWNYVSLSLFFSLSLLLSLYVLYFSISLLFSNYLFFLFLSLFLSRALFLSISISIYLSASYFLFLILSFFSFSLSLSRLSLPPLLLSLSFYLLSIGMIH